MAALLVALLAAAAAAQALAAPVISGAAAANCRSARDDDAPAGQASSRRLLMLQRHLAQLSIATDSTAPSDSLSAQRGTGASGSSNTSASRLLSTNSAGIHSGDSTGPEPPVRFSELTGCTYRVQPNDTFHSIAKALNIEMDTLELYNYGDDLTAPNAIQNKAGKDINIPCPGTMYYQYLPYAQAGCFFNFTVDQAHPSIMSIVKYPPTEVPGPFSIQGIWIANYQNFGIDITRPGEYYTGRSIILPTCGHTGKIVGENTPFNPGVGCAFNPSLRAAGKSTNSTSSLTWGQLAREFRLSLTDLLQRNGVSDPNAVLPNRPVNIPCPA